MSSSFYDLAPVIAFSINLWKASISGPDSWACDEEEGSCFRRGAISLVDPTEERYLDLAEAGL
jgi:hypothetical protein